MKIELKEMGEAYQATVLKMHERMNVWRKANPKSEVLIHFKTSDGQQMKLVVIAPIRMAISLGIITVNEAAYEMIRAMCEPEAHKPTLSMVEAAINLETKEKENHE